ncbi:MAG: aminodeoxychorismate lyase [Cellvibrionales bacterium TMED49]|nr:MAG: aminodeoxychorismate lyase [Cellvibrionales bacterium TMED49]OUU38910.1 MAG: aminodeoxychorismate lyase [Cellvibrionales bacterium TMED49]|tara:strand:+ start:34 stop:888 length:855 start_codon:yes stop_codon:yes gene_type:complete
MSSRYEAVMIGRNFISESSVFDHLHMFGHGVFETMRVFKRDIPLLCYHMERIHKHAKRIYIQTEIRDIRKQIINFLSNISMTNSENGILRLIVTSGRSASGYRIDKTCKPTYIFSYRTLPTESSCGSLKGMKMRVCDYRLPGNPVLSGIKHLNRLDQILARSEWDEQFDDGVMLDQNDLVVETTFGNIFLLTTNGWVTPLIEECGIEGVMRDLIVKKVMPVLSEAVDIRKVKLNEIKNCSEWFVCNAVRGIMPVSSLFPDQSWLIGKETKKLRKALFELYPCYA